jgi:hypothetical protein
LESTLVVVDARTRIAEGPVLRDEATEVPVLCFGAFDQGAVGEEAGLDATISSSSVPDTHDSYHGAPEIELAD